MITDLAGSVLVTADGETISAGKPVRIFNIHIISSGGGAAVVSLKNSGAAGTIYIKETGTVSTGKTFDYGLQGQLFPLGCYVDIDANTTSVLLSARKEP